MEENFDRCLSHNDACNVCNPQLELECAKSRESMDELVDSSTKFREAQAIERIYNGEGVASTLHHQATEDFIQVLLCQVEVHSPLHSGVYILDPEYWNLDLMSKEEVIHDFYQVINTFFSNAKYQISGIKQLIVFGLKEGIFANEFVQLMAKEQSAWKW